MSIKMEVTQRKNNEVRTSIEITVQGDIPLITTIGLPSCVSCEHFDLEAQVCNKFNNIRPPARVIVEGCEAYEESIPF